MTIRDVVRGDVELMWELLLLQSLAMPPENLMMVPESLLVFVDEAKMTGQLENPKRRF
jgi:hypothetical protein